MELEEKLNGWFSERNAARAERDTANALSLSLCADRDGDAKDRDDEIAVLRADVARLREILQRIVSNGGSATNAMLFDARTALAK